MKMLLEFPHRVISTLRSRFRPDPAPDAPAPSAGKGQNLLRLHEYQHRVIVDIFKTSVAGFFAFSLILLSFALHTLLDPRSPSWLAYLMTAVSAALAAGLYRTLREFRSYSENYEEITEQLRAKVVQSLRPGSAPAAKAKGGVEQRLLSSLKPREHKGWDAKSCKACGRAIELLVTVCPACGNDQEDLLVN
jgi:hypothetical protein